MCTSLTGAKTGWALFHISNRKNWEFPNPRDFRHVMDMKFVTFLHEFKELLSAPETEIEWDFAQAYLMPVRLTQTQCRLQEGEDV